MHRQLWAVLFLAVILGSLPGTAAVPAPQRSVAGPCYVRLNDGPYPSVQAAVDASADPNDEVKVAGYCPGISARAGITQSVYLTKTLTIQGGYTLTNWTDPDPVAYPTTLDALGQGRVLYIVGDIAPVIAGLQITGGDATGQSGDPWGHHRGGGILVAGATITVSHCAVYSNTADHGGGMFAYGSIVTLLENTFTHNDAAFTGGGLLDYDGTIHIASSTFRHNVAGTGGGLYLGSDAVTLTANTIVSNTAIWDGGGVIVEVYGGYSTLLGNYIAGNYADWNGGGLYFGEAVLASCEPAPHGIGAAIDCPHHPDAPPANIGRNAGGPLAGRLAARREQPDHHGKAPLLLAGNVIVDNSARKHGGGVFMSGNGGAAFLQGNLVYDNHAQEDGGGIYLDWSVDPTPIHDNTVTGNTAGRNGGGVFLGGPRATLHGNLVSDNRAEQDGGGIYLAWHTFAVLLYDNTVTGNSAGAGGGGIYMGHRDYLGGSTLEGNRVAGNSAAAGGGLYVLETSVIGQGNLFLENLSAGPGGGLWLSASHFTLTNNMIADNQAGSQGSGLYAEDCSAQLLHNTVARNTGGDGSGLHLLESTMRLSNTILVSHTVGLYAAAGCTVTLEATLWGNDTDWAGPGTIVTGTVNLWGAPAFVDPDAGDYHIGPTSAAVDNGIDAGVASDIDGDPRPMGAGFDIGADEIPWACWMVYLPLVAR